MSNQTWLSISITKITRVATLLVLISMLTACGGGGGDTGGGSGSSGGGSAVGGTVSLKCYTTSGDTTPETLYSFADFQAVISDCAAIAFKQSKLNYTYFSGKTFHSQNDPNDVYAFDNTSTTPTSSAPATGTYSNSTTSTTIPFTWYIEVDGSNTYLDVNSNDKTISMTSVYYLQVASGGTPGVNGVKYEVRTYYEDSVNLGSDMNRAIGSDGEINDDVMVQDSGGSVALATCNGFDPSALYSFDNFQMLLADCGTAKKFNYSYLAGKTFTTSNGETIAFGNTNSSPTVAATASGTYTGSNASVLPFTWYIEDAGGYTYAVILANDGTQDIRITWSIISETGTPGTDGVVYDLRAYQEFGSNTTENPMVRSTGTDGQIGMDSFTQSASGTTTTLTCSTASTYDTNDYPLSLFTFADYEAIVADCGSAMTFDHTWFDGKTFDSGGTLLTFNADGTGTSNDTHVPTFTWHVEQATGGYNYLVSEYSCAAAQCGARIDFRDTIAIIGLTGTRGVSGATYDLRWYSESSQYTTENPITRATGADATVDNADKFIEQ